MFVIFGNKLIHGVSERSLRKDFEGLRAQEILDQGLDFDSVCAILEGLQDVSWQSCSCFT